jgi:NADH-quinone oxidoreductase subunit N
MTMGSFGVVMLVAGEGERRLDLNAYQGLGWRRPGLAIAMTVFLLSLAGFPLTGGFVGKVFILRSAVEQGLLLVAIVLVLTSLISYFYYLRVVWFMWFREATDAVPAVPVAPTGLRLALAIAVAGILITGIFPGAVLELAERSAATLAQAPGALFGSVR